jgi:hypothetical protein
MPNCFSLTRIGEKEPEKFAKIDEEMCREFGVEPDPVKFYNSWFDVIGLGLACGWDWEKIKEINKDWPEILLIIDWLEKNYVYDSWYESR